VEDAGGSRNGSAPEPYVRCAEPYVRCPALLRRPRGELVAGRNVVERFHMHYFNSLVWGNDTYWLGIPTQKLPLDIWIY